MNAETWATVIAAVAGAAAAAAALIALRALRYSRQSVRAAERAAEAAEEQSSIQRQLRIDGAQPYVWVDIRPDEATGTLLNLVIGNSGPTVATAVRVTVDPPLPAIGQLKERAKTGQDRLADGISSLPPGRTLVWPLGQGFNLIKEDGLQAHTFTVTANGPFGVVPQLTYIVALSDWRGMLDRPSGNLHLLTKAVQDLTGKIGS